MARWSFYDPLGPTTYTFVVNPSSGGSPGFKKNLLYQSTAAPDGQTIVMEGRDEVQMLEWSGVILEQAQYDAFVTWFQKRHQVRVTDDLGRQFWIYIASFTPNRERAIHSPWKHSYQVSAVILDWV